MLIRLIPSTKVARKNVQQNHNQTAVLLIIICEKIYRCQLRTLLRRPLWRLAVTVEFIVQQ